MNRAPVSGVAAAPPTRRRTPRRVGPRIRFAADRAGLDEALACDAPAGASPRRTRRIRSIFFDTAAGDLGKSDIVLHGYELRGAPFLALTWSRPALRGPERSSLELRVPKLDFGADLFDASQDLRRSVGGRPLEARCVVETERSERLVDVEDARLAVLFDDGFVEASGERIPFHEIELRLVEGSAPRLWRFATELSRRLPVRRLPMSATEIAVRRMSGRGVPTVKALRSTLERDASLDDAIAAILGSCLDQFEANWPAFDHSGDPQESIHQMRVALRRLRAGVGLLGRGVHGPALESAGARAKAIAATLGAARNWDVLRDMLADASFASLSEEPSFYAVLDAVERRRAEMHGAVRALVAARETTQFVLDLRAALAAREWTAVGDEAAEAATPPSHAPRPARDFAVRSLDRLHRRAAKRARELASLTPEQRHEARIALKKLRYAAEFFEPLFGAPRAARKYLRRTASIQDALGASNDVATAIRLLQEIGAELGERAAPVDAFLIGWCAHAQSGMGADWKAAEKCLRKLEPFWR